MPLPAVVVFPAGRSVAGCPLTNTTFTNGVSSVNCFTPAEGCFPGMQQGGPGPVLDSNSTSGWTEDGRALQSIGAALGLQPGALAYPAPCALRCPEPPPPGNNSAPYYMPPPQGVCFHCDSYTGAHPYDRPLFSVNTLDLTQLVTAGVIPASMLRLVPQMAALQHLRVLKASGFSMQGEQAAGGAAATGRYRHGLASNRHRGAAHECDNKLPESPRSFLSHSCCISGFHGTVTG